MSWKRTSALLCALAVMALPLPVAAQDDTLPFEGYTNEHAGLMAEVPAGWLQTSGGLFIWDSAQADVVVLEVTLLPPVPLEDQLDVYAGLYGLDAFPAPASVHETEYLTWDLYAFEGTDAFGNAISADVALAETKAGTLWVSLIASPDVYDDLHDTVFVRVMESVRPLPDEMHASVPYEQEIVSFPSSDGVVLTGTLTLPPSEGPHPAVVLVSGSGAQDRDENMQPLAAIKPFALIADHLTRAGVAVLRYDDRGVGQSWGDHNAATTADFADDAEAAVDYLRARDDIDPAQVGLLGHSEGGIVAPMVAARSPHVAFVIAMAPPSVSGKEVLLLQNQLVLRAGGLPEMMIDARVDFVRQAFDYVIAGDSAELEAHIRADIEASAGGLSDDYKQQLVAQQMAGLDIPWMRYFLAYDPAPDWAQTTVPVLAVYGGLDLQVDAEQNIGPLRDALDAAGNMDVTVITLDGANHLFQPAITGSPDEFGRLEQTFVPEFLPTITEWLLARVDVR